MFTLRAAGMLDQMELESLGFRVDRVEGANRYETAAQLAVVQSEVKPIGTMMVEGREQRTALLVSGEINRLCQWRYCQCAHRRRRPKSAVVATGHDFTRLEVVMPHPIYAWMGWAQVLSPSDATFQSLQPLFVGSYGRAVRVLARRKPV